MIEQPNQIIQMLEWGHYYRSIPLDNRPHPSQDARFWMGSARGRWDGDTLVIDVTNLNGKLWLDSVGNFYSEKAHVTERVRLADANTLDYEVTIDDPSVFTQVWKLDYPLRRARAATAQDPYANEAWEHACHEGNSQHIEGTKSLGFRWYVPPVPPAR